MVSTSSHSIFLISIHVLRDVNNAVHCLRIAQSIIILSFCWAPTPYWGLFLSEKVTCFLQGYLKIIVSVPVLGIIFLSMIFSDDPKNSIAGVFPSPYWGLFFYRLCRYGRKVWSKCSVSVPILGIILLSPKKWRWVIIYYKRWFPSPYWGLFFYHLKKVLHI